MAQDSRRFPTLRKTILRQNPDLFRLPHGDAATRRHLHQSSQISSLLTVSYPYIRTQVLN